MKHAAAKWGQTNDTQESIMNKATKIVIILVINVIVCGGAVLLYLEAEKQKRRAAFAQEMHLQMLGIDPNASDKRSPVRVILTMGDCNTQADDNGTTFTGETAVAYCAADGVGFHPRLETTCMHEGLRQASSYYDFEEPTKADYVALACDIASSYEATSEDWEDNVLTDGMRGLLNYHLSRD